MESLLATCDRDGVAPLFLRHVEPGARVLEAGCGAGRYVRYLADRGYDATGIELSAETVEMVHRVWPDVSVLCGDVLDLPFGPDEFEGVLSLGVVEHFEDGPGRALREIRRVLKAGRTAVITVPCLNSIRRVKRALWVDELQHPRALLRALSREPSAKLTRRLPGSRYAVYPAYGDFFEYRMTHDEFAAEVEDAGLEILEHVPIGQIDGLYHDLNPFGRLVAFSDWKFTPTPTGERLNRWLSRKPFAHSHMQAVVVRKPLDRNTRV